MNISDLQNSGVLDRLLSEADKLYQLGRVQQAADTFLQTIEQFPGDKRSYHAFTKMLIDGSQFEEGLALLQKIPNGDGAQKTHELMGYCLMGLGRLDEAIEHSEKMLSDNPKSAQVLNLLGQLAVQQGDLKRAANYFSRAIKSEPDYGLASVNLGKIQWDSGQKKKALDLIETGFISAPTELTAATTYHVAAIESGALDRSETVFKTAVKHNPYNERLQYLLIDILLKQQKHQVAFNEIKRAMAAFGINDGTIAVAAKVKALAEQGKIKNAAKKGCTLSVCMIVKNEASHLAKCLQSVEPIADELIVVDTGSTDLTKDIADIFGAKVFDFKWADDFAKAKNYAISRASGEWILSLDADEVISPLDHESLRKLIEEGPVGSAAFSIVTRNYMNRLNAVGWSPNDGKYPLEEAGYGWFPSEKVRLFPNDARIRFDYPVHEMLEPALTRLNIDILPCHIPVHHYGKLDERNSAAKGQRYYEIGIKKLAKMEHDVGAIRELAVQATNLERYEEAVNLWLKVIRLQPKMADAYVNLGTAYWNIGRYQQAAESARKAIELAPDMKEARFNYCLSLLHLGQAGAASPVLESLVEKCPEYLSARFLLAAVKCCSGKSQKGMQMLQNLRHSKLGPGLPVACHTMAQGLWSAGQLDYAKSILDATCRTGNANDDVQALLETCNDLLQP